MKLNSLFASLSLLATVACGQNTQNSVNNNFTDSVTDGIDKSRFMDIIKYGSLHGAAKRYAEGLSKGTGIKAVLATYGQKVDYVDLSTLAPIIRSL